MSGVNEHSANESIVIQAGEVSMSVLPRLGARITSFAIDGQNVLLEASAVAGTENANNFGASFWPSPQAAWGWPPIPAIDNLPFTVERGEELVLRSAPGALLDGAAVSLVKTFTALPRQSAIDVTYTLTNVGNLPATLAGWQIARVPSHGLTFFRLGEGGVSSDKLATVTKDGVQWYAYDASVVVSQGQKTFADGKGWLAHAMGDLLLVQTFPDVAPGAAAPGEAEVELYADPTHTYVEIEPQGRLESLQPGQSSTPWTVRWYLRRLPAGIPVSVGSVELLSYVEALTRS